MKKKKLIGIISSLGIGLLTIGSVVSCTTQNNSQNVNSKTANKIVNSLTNYFNNKNNQTALINYLVNNGYITYANGTWDYDTTPYNSNPNYSYSVTSWNSALSIGISYFIYLNRNIWYDGILGSKIYGIDGYMTIYNGYGNIPIINASYSNASGLVFKIAYNNISASSSVTIATNTLNNFINEKTRVANALTTYFSDNNNQMALINYLLNNDYIKYTYNGMLTYGHDYSNGSGYTSWTSALTAGINSFISSNQNTSYDGILGSNIDAGNNTFNNDDNLSISSASYSVVGGLVFSIMCGASSVNISANTLNNWIDENSKVINALTTYFSNSNNQIALINYLINNNYIVHPDGSWNYNTSTSVNGGYGYTSWISALSNGISSFIANNQNISYEGIFGSSMNVGQYYELYNDNADASGFYANDLSITNASYSTSSGLVFSIAYNNISASNSVTISANTLNNYNEITDQSNATIANSFTTYFSDSNNQMALIKYLLNSHYDYITYNNGIWTYGNSYSSWTEILSNAISSFVLSNQSISYDGVLGSSINASYISNDLSVTSASYSITDGLIFKIACSGISASSSITISDSTLNNYSKIINSSNVAIANALSTYFSEANNQMALMNYLLNSRYHITYNNKTQSYNTGNYASWTSALSEGISAFIYSNQDISYDGILGSSMNIGQYYMNIGTNLAVAGVSYNAVNGLIFKITYNGISANNSITISANTLNNYGKTINSSNVAITNALTTYFGEANNQMALINYLLNNNYIAYSNKTWSYDGSGYSSWADMLSNGIGEFISSNNNISYDGVLGLNISIEQNYYSRYSTWSFLNTFVTSASYDSSNGLVFTIAYNNVNATSNITISNETLNDSINSNS